MIIKNGKVLAINSVKHDATLQGNGLSGTPLGVNTDILTPYAKTNDVNQEFVDTSAWVNKRFDDIPGAAAYSGKDGIKVDGHMISVSADFATKAYVNAADDTVKTWVEDKQYLQSDALNGYAKESWANNKFLTKTSADTLYQPLGTYLTPDALNPYLTKASADTIYQPIGSYATSAYVQEEIAKIPGATEYSGGKGISVKNYIIAVSADYLPANALDGYATEQWVLGKNYLTSASLTPYAKTEDVEQEFTDISACIDNKFQVKGDYITSAAEQFAGKNLVLKDNKWVEAPSGTVYTQGDNINISPDGVISGRNWTPELAEKVDKDLFIETSAALATEIGKKLYTSATEDWDVTQYSAGNDYITVQNHKIYGHDWTTELNEKQDLLTIEQISAISSVSAIQIVSGNWVTSADNFEPNLSYVLEKDNDTTKWVGYDLSDIGKTYKQGANIAITEDNTISGRDWTPELGEKVDADEFEEVVTKIETEVGKKLYTSATEDWDVTPYSAGNDLIDVRDHKIYGYDWTNEISAKVDQDEFDVTVDQIADVCVTLSGAIDEVSATIDDLSATVERDYVKKGEIPEPVFYDISAKYAMAQSGTYNDKDYYFISGAEIVGSNGVSAEYNEETNTWDIGLSANDLEYMYDTYRSNNTVISAGTIIPFNGTNYHNIVVDANGLITLPETTNKFTFCINETIEGNNPGTHAYLLNKLILSATDNTELVSTQNYYPTEVGTSNATIAITVDHTVAPTRKYCVVYDGSEIPATAHLNVTASIVEEVVSTNDTSVLMNVYTGDSPISVNNDNRKIGLKYDNQIFTLNSNNQLTLTNGSTDTPIDPVVFDKLVNSINGRMTETIPFGALNTVGDLVGSMQYSYLFRPAIEYEFSPLTQAYMNGGNADANEYVSVAVYEGVAGQSKMLWESEYGLIPTAGGQVVMNTRNLYPIEELGTMYPEQLYYVCIRIDKLNDHGGTWHNVLGLGMGSNTSVDIGNPKPWLGLQNITTLDFIRPYYDFANAGSMDKFGGIKPYVGFRTRTN
ncbi:MAG: hypothetical protein IJH63_13945 [Methanobrevibacter sp.]|nr:hypothetical protein [Methanobrevibacter sp.]